MKKYLVNLIILALMLTAPLSFTGDRCPDFKPDCCRSKYIAEAVTISVSRQRTAPRKMYLHSIRPVFSASADSVLNLTNTANYQQFILESHLGRAPPQHHSVSA